jgi:hypothetical protein
MAALTGQTIASSYEQLLHVDRDGGGNSTTHVSIKDGDNGTTFGFTIATDALMMTSTNRLEFGDTGTYIHQSADGVLDLVSDTELELNATTIDINGAVEVSGNLTHSGDVIIDADDKALVLGADQDASIFSDAAGIIKFVRGQDYTTTAGDDEGWVQMSIGSASESYISVYGGEAADATLGLNADNGDNDADYWRLVSDASGNFKVESYATGAWVSHLQSSSAGAVFNESGAAALDFRVESDSNTHMLFVDSGNNKIGIGDDAPPCNLQIKGSGTVNIGLESTDNAQNLDIDYYDNANNPYGRIRYHEGEGHWKFQTNVTSSSTDLMVIAASGNVGIGNTSLETWTSDYSVLQLGGAASFSATTTQAAGDVSFLSHNCYYDTTNSRWEYMSTNADDEASQIYQQNGAIVFRNASAAGADDAAVSFTTSMKVDYNSQIFTSNEPAENTGNTIFGYTAMNAGSNNGSDHNTVVGHLAMGTGTVNGAEYNTVVGYRAGDDITSGDKSVYIGAWAGDASADVDNAVAIGYAAMGSGTTDSGADGSVSIGYYAGNALTSGAGNVLVGKDTGKLLTTGSYNTVLGHEAGDAFATNTNHNTAIGYQALTSANNSGDGKNVAIGSGAGALITSGADNICIGKSAGDGFDTESQNIAIGSGAFGGSVNGADACVAIGYGAMYGAATEDGTVAIGKDALGSLTGGVENIAVGYQALNSATSCGANVAIGYQAADALAVGESHNIAIGSAALGAVDEGTAGGDADHNIAIGSSALTGGDFGGSDRQLQGNIAIGGQAMDGTGSNAQTGTIAIGKLALTALTSGAGNTAIGYNSQAALEGGSGNVSLGYNSLDAVVGGSHNVAIGYDALTTCAGNASHNTGVGRDALKTHNVDGDGNNTAIGSEAGTAVTDGVKNCLMGAGAGKAMNSGHENVILGYHAGDSTQNTGYSVIIGSEACQANMTADTDGTIAIGKGAMAALTTGGENIAIGYLAMDAMQEGHNNIALGHHAFGSANNSGSDRNIAIGNYALDATSTNALADCVAIGYAALGAVTSGSYNVGIGAYAGDEVTTGEANTIVGSYAMHNADGDEDHNTCIGYAAGDVIDGGNYNTIIGSVADPGTAAASNQTVIGYDAVGQGNGTVTLGNDSVTDVYMADDSGALVHAAGIQFPASQVANGGANVLDDYEEGVHAVTLGGASFTMHSSKNSLQYTKIGRLVTLSGEISVTGVSSATGTFTISLPFTVADTDDLAERFQGTFSCQNIDFSGDYLNIGSYAAQDQMTVQITNDNGSWTYLHGNTFSSTSEFVVSVQYIT